MYKTNVRTYVLQFCGPKCHSPPTSCNPLHFSPSAAVVQRLGSLCGIMGNVGFMKCILHKVEASGVHSDTSFEAHVEGTAAHQTVGLLPSPDDCVESHFH